MSNLLNKMKMFMLSLAVIIFLAACTNNNAAKNVTVTDLIERNVEVNKGSYKRVVCIGAGALRLYTYIGDVSLLSGVEDIDNESLTQRPKMFDGVARPYFMANREAFKNLPSCGVGGPQSQSAEKEKILNCNPDIIISEYEDKDKADKLQEDLNVPVIVVSYGPNGVFDAKLEKSLNLLGDIFNRAERAKTINDFISKEKALLQDRTKDINKSSQKKVYVMGLGNWGTTNHLMTAQNYVPFNICNINNIITGLAKDGIQAIEAEKFEELAPNIDIMIMDAAAVKNIKGLYNNNPSMFDNCKAWTNNEVYIQMAYNAYYTNLEIALCNTWFNAKVVYPNLFNDIDIKNKLDEITNVFLNKKLADDIYNYPMSYGGYGKINKETIFA